MNGLRKIRKFISSMPFAISILCLLALACALSSLVTQGQSYGTYAEKYGERGAALILALGLDDAYHSWWFVGLSGFLCLSLIFCNVSRLPSVIRKWKAHRSAGDRPDASAPALAVLPDHPEAVFSALRFGSPGKSSTADGREALRASRGSAGLWGPWICHLGILLLVAGFALGQMTQKQYTVYGVPGQTKALGDTGLAVTIDDFRTALREDGSAEQYTAALTVTDRATGRQESGSTSVNEPATLFGMKFYQNSTGYAARVTVLKEDAPLQEETLCVGEVLGVADRPELAICFQAFYPDYVSEPGSRPTTASGQMNHPAYLYMVYYQGNLLGMNVLQEEEKLTIDEYTVLFSDPQAYTLLSVRYDAFTPLALAGGIVILIGLLLAFYIRPASLQAVRGEDGAWTLSGECRRGGALFQEEIRDAVLKAGGSLLPAEPAPETPEDRSGDPENGGGTSEEEGGL